MGYIQQCHYLVASASLSAVIGCTQIPVSPSAQVHADLAGSGKFRVGIYPLNPVQVSMGAQTGNYEGLVIDVGRLLADRLGAIFVPIPFTDLDNMGGCVARGECDAMVIATGAAIAKDFEVTSGIVEVDNSYLVRADSPILSVKDMDQRGMRVAAYTGIAVDLFLKAHLKQAEIRTTTRGPARAQWLRDAQVDAVADSVLVLRTFFMPQVPGSRLVEGAYSTTTYALAVAQGRRAGADFLKTGITDFKRSGQLSDSIARWNLNVRVAK